MRPRHGNDLLRSIKPDGFVPQNAGCFLASGANRSGRSEAEIER
jgi:hypothetical protein